MKLLQEITENVARYHGDDFNRALKLLQAVEELTRSNGFREDIVEFLSEPSKYSLVPTELLQTSSAPQMSGLDSPVVQTNDALSSLPPSPTFSVGHPGVQGQGLNHPSPPGLTNTRQAWPSQPFPSSPRFATPSPNPSSLPSPPMSWVRDTRQPISSPLPTNTHVGQSSPRIQIDRNPKLPIKMSPSLITRFIELSAANSSNKKETGATFGGALSDDESCYVVDHLFVPDQQGFSTYYKETNSAVCAHMMIARNRLNLGTIHTHPGILRSFMSSVDLHMHTIIQKDISSAIALVHSPKYNTTPAFSMTEYGLCESSFSKL